MTDALDNLIKAAKAVARHEQAYRQCARPERWPIMMPVGELLDLSDAVAAVEAAPAAVPASVEVEKLFDAFKMARTRLEEFADDANAGRVEYNARELKRRIWGAFADFDTTRAALPPSQPASGEGKLRGALEQLEQKAEAFRAATIENGILIRSAQNLYIDELRALEGAIADARHALSATALTMV